MAPPDLDRWLEDPGVRTRHARTACADATTLWSAAESIRLTDTRSLGRLVRWRIPGVIGTTTFAELLAEYPFCVLESGPACSVSGLCGRIWTLARDYPRLDGPAEFEAWDRPGTVRVVIAQWARERGDGRSELVSEARVQATDHRANLRLRAVWTLLGRFEALIAREPLALAVRRAESGG